MTQATKTPDQTQQPTPPKTNQQSQELSIETKTVIVIILLAVIFPAGLVLMWVWMKNWPKWVKILITMLPLIPIISVLFLLFFIFQAVKQNPQNIHYSEKVEISQTPTAPADWKTYENTAIGYTFTYPSEWKTEEQTDLAANFAQQVYIKDPKKDSQYTYRFYVAIEKQRTYEEIIARLGGGDMGFASNVEKKEEITLGGLRATKVTLKLSELDHASGKWEDTGKSTEVVVDRKNPIIIFLYDATDEMLFEKILSTFTFDKLSTSKFTDQTTQGACTKEAKLCTDGKTYVGREGPNCEFSKCPSTVSPLPTRDYKLDQEMVQ